MWDTITPQWGEGQLPGPADSGAQEGRALPLLTINIAPDRREHEG